MKKLAASQSKLKDIHRNTMPPTPDKKKFTTSDIRPRRALRAKTQATGLTARGTHEPEPPRARSGVGTRSRFRAAQSRGPTSARSAKTREIHKYLKKKGNNGQEFFLI